MTESSTLLVKVVSKKEREQTGFMLSNEKQCKTIVFNRHYGTVGCHFVNGPPDRTNSKAKFTCVMVRLGQLFVL
jgi:hypothetical protein